MDSPARPSQAKMASSTGGTEGSSPASSPASAASLAAMAAPKFGTLVPNRIFVGGISANTSEAELAALFSAYGNVKATKIIADRGGVSKGYGFVTFETEEEAKRLQQESECITLRERKLNIAPAIKKQPFNRSFDGGTGSPPAVPTSTYYYTNGMGLPYQNGMTFYNAGAPTPGAAMAPPTDPTTLYQAAGVFGPQATASHQTFAPMMYPVPAPSLYMPQQYQYSPMPYEPYFSGTTAAGAPQYLYTANGAQATQSGSGNGSASSSGGSTAASAAASGVSNPASAAMGPSPATFQTHFYSPTGAATSHHPHPASISTGGPHGPPPQMEHLYYSYPPPPHAAQAPPPHHAGPLALANDQQLLVYTTDIGGPPSYITDTQLNQPEECRSTSSHSEPQQQLQSGIATTSDSGGGGGGGGGANNSASITQATAQPSSDPNVPTVLPLVPLKYPMSNRYHPTFHPVAIHSVPQHVNTSPQQQQQQQQTNNIAGNNSSNTSNNNAISDSTSDETTNAPVHYRAVSVYHHPTPLYIPQNAATSPYHHPPGNSLLPTPPQQPYDLSAPKFREFSPASAGKPGTYIKGGPPPPQLAQPLMHQSAAYVKQYNGPPLHPHTLHKYARVGSPPARLSQHQQQSMGRRGGGLSPAGCYLTPKGQYSNSRQQFVYTGQSPYVMPQQAASLHRGFNFSYEYVNSGRRSSEPDAGRRRNAAIVNSYRGSNLTMSPAASSALDNCASKAQCEKYASDVSKTGNSTVIESNSTSAAATTPTTITVAAMTTSSGNNATASETDGKTATSSGSNSNSPPPPPTSSSPMTSRPHPNLSPSPNPNQVQQQQQQFGQRYNSGISSQQQQRGGRYQTGISNQRGKGGMRQASTKFKLNGIVQPPGNLKIGEVSAAGDAPMLPITPPGTPQQQSDQQQANDACHHMQALSL